MPRPGTDEFPCDCLREQAQQLCPDHPDLADCPDALVLYSARVREWALPIRDGGSARVGIASCPWCGVALPASLRDAWVATLDAMDIGEDDEIPARLQTSTWWRARGL